MTDFKTIEPKPGVKMCIVKVPDDATSFSIKNTRKGKPDQLHYFVPYTLDVVSNQRLLILPMGDYEILGLSTELTEEQCAELVESGGTSIEYGGETEILTGFDKSIDCYGRAKWTKVTSIFYKNYSKPPHKRAMCWTASFPTAKESFDSLMQSIGCYSENPYGEEPINVGGYFGGDMVVRNIVSEQQQRHAMWKEAQSKVAKYLILKIVE